MIRTIKEKEIIPLTFDAMFSEIFNDKENICVLEEFIAGYFNYPLTDVRGNLELLSRRLPKESHDESRKEVDLLLNLNGKKINIEMSNNNSQGIVDRDIIYLCKIHGGQLKRGDNTYSKIHESIQIVFNNFDCQKKLKKTYYLRDDEGNILSEKFKIDIINLVKGKELCYTLDGGDNYLINWCKILTENKIDNFKNISHQVLSNESTNQLIDKISILSGEDNMVRLYAEKNRQEMEHNTIMEEYGQKIQAIDQKIQAIEQEKQAIEQEKQAIEQEKQAIEQEKQAIEQEYEQKRQKLEQEKTELEQRGQELEQKDHELEQKKQKLFENGFNDGIKQTNIEIAKKMLDEDTDINFITKITGLSFEEINDLKVNSTN